MSLKKYQSKRTFDKTNEPNSLIKHASKNTPPRFCVQKHDASTLHYDFRLEYEGILLSWAIPKGPSLNPADKRLAIQVEDHPFDYKDLEGVIPQGNYGAGAVMLWDEGSYFCKGTQTAKENAIAIKKGLKKGHLEFVLNGEKLRGSFHLVKIQSSSDKNHWLLIKQKDEYVEESSSAILKKWDYSVKTQRTLQEIRGGVKQKPPHKKLPPFFKPMLATLVKDPFDDFEWLFEIKWDGYRASAYIDEQITLFSRNENIFNDLFPKIVKDLHKIKAQVILDGEIVILDDNGKSNFQLMQNYQNTQKGALYFYVFDLLYRNGEDLRKLPLIERKERLKTLLDSSSLTYVRYSEHVEEKGVALFEQALQHHLEGVVAKRKDSPYLSLRSKQWLKIKTQARQETIIIGFTAPKGSRKHFGALLLGMYDKQNELTYIGRVGTGFSADSLTDIAEKLKPLIQKKSALKEKVNINGPVVWVKPLLVCEVSFSEWTTQGLMRHPTFKGLRMDKKTPEIKKETANSIKKRNLVHLINPEKVYWPKEKYTKADLMHYYREVAAYILPFLKNRPIMLRRFPEGIEGISFVQKDTKSLHLPDWIQTVEIAHEDKVIHYFLVQNEATLEYVINLGAIELHPFHVQVGHLDYPDYFVLDLDPESVAFEQVVKAAKTIHQLLVDLKIPHYCKTSGGRGLHFYIPLGARYTEEQIKKFGEILGLLTHEALPGITSLERSPSKRQKKIYVDVLQNRSKQTVVAPYSVRGRPGALVSTPINFNELEKDIHPQDFTIKTVPKRLKKIGEIFAPILGEGVDLLQWIDDQRGP